jgi:hypothetical protein
MQWCRESVYIYALHVIVLEGSQDQGQDQGSDCGA